MQANFLRHRHNVIDNQKTSLLLEILVSDHGERVIANVSFTEKSPQVMLIIVAAIICKMTTEHDSAPGKQITFFFSHRYCDLCCLLVFSVLTLSH